MANEFSNYSFLWRFFMELVYLHFVRNEFFIRALNLKIMLDKNKKVV